MNLKLTEVEHQHLIEKLTFTIDHRQAILKDPDAEQLGANIAAITAKLEIEKSIVTKLQKSLAAIYRSAK